ncbi:biliverdin-producing heme oxygenase [Halomonas sp. MA07-2]|uniref:biliverdin-producing heme oxygenase n=1 Tax=Halomonas sp. MA07-2 TaxID=3440841 RepID=UPI003EEE13DA
MDDRQGYTVLQRLREATRTDHHALDHHPELQRLVRSGLTRESYARSLLAMHGPHAALESAVFEGAVLLSVSDQISPMRLPQLQADLAALGIMPQERVMMPGMQVPATRAELLGVRYVLEGSRLGAEVIARCIRESLGSEVPLSFLGAPGACRYWPRYVDQAVLDCPGEGEQRQAMVAARRAFAAYRAGLDSSLPNDRLQSR